jgi:SAM-dependent methyltransferase
MVARTRADLVARGLAWAEIQLMSAEHLQFADSSFTHVLCSYAVFFFADLPRVLAEMRRVLRPSGVVGFAFQRGVDPRWAWYEDLLREQGALDNLPVWPSSGGIRQEGALQASLSAAGFANAREYVEEVELGYADAETWWASLWTHGSRTPLERLAPEPLARIQAICLERARALGGPDGLPERHRFVFVTATKPLSG